MAMNALRTIKIRSVVDATYSKNYNRLEFKIEPDSYSTDLSESYLALRMYLAHQDLTKYTSTELLALAGANIYVSFGNAGISYAPTCLIKLARLYANNNQSTPLEEINFQNVLTETLHQLCEDFEDVGSSSLLSNSSVRFGAPQSLTSFFANLLPDSVGQSEVQVPIEVHIPLKKIFGFFENKNCYLDDEALGGLRLVFELEDQKQLLQAQVVTEKVICPPIATAIQVGLEPSLAVNPYTSLTQQVQVGQPTELTGDPLVPQSVALPAVDANIMNPASFKVYSDQIGVITTNASTTTINLIGTTWTAPILASMWIVAQNWVKLNYSVKANPAGQFANDRQQTSMSSMAYINEVILAAGAVALTLGDILSAPLDTNWLYTLDSLEFFDVAQPGPAPPLHYGQHIIQLSPMNTQNAGTYLPQNQILVSPDVIKNIVAAGLISSDDGTTYTPNGAQFKLNVQVTGTTIVGEEDTNYFPVQQDFNVYTAPDNPNTRSIQSNMLQPLPVQGSRCSILNITPSGQNFLLTLTDLGFANFNSLQPAVRLDGVYYTAGSTYSGYDVDILYNFWITNFNDANVGWDGSGNAIYAVPQPDYTYLIDKSELVLVQQARVKGVPMSRMYFTSRVESATIETELPIYTRQFIVTEPNCYSILMCTPQYVATATQPECLASWHRGVSRYRFSVNNIDDTNRDLEVWTNNSHYPSSLHLEKTMDALSNDGKMVKSLSGLLSVPYSYNPIVAFPLKIYDVMDSPTGYKMKPEGYIVQWTAYGDPTHNSPVQPGVVYFFKRCLKTF